MVKTKIGDYDVYDTGVLVNPFGTEIDQKLGDDSQFKVELRFISDPEDTKARLEGYTLDESKIGIGLTFINFKNTLGSGNSQYIRVGWLEGRSLFFSFRIYSINEEKGVLIYYTWLLGKKVNENGDEIE